MFGITENEFELLCNADTRALLEKQIECDPSTLALKGVSREVCNQIKYLQRCKSKLPSYYNSRCIIPPLSYEQASSELSSLVRSDHGERLLDLTCGLGVDTFHFSHLFTHVTAIERDPLLAAIAQENFRRLERENIMVVNSSCEDFLTKYEGEKFDLVYVDPARRDITKRVFLLEDCSPNIVELLPNIENISKRLIIKLSPLFDMEEARRIFPEGATLRAVSVGGECKELCVEIDFGYKGASTIITSCIDKGERIKEHTFTFEEVRKNHHSKPPIGPLENYRYLSILDVAFRKMRCSECFYAQYLEGNQPLYDQDVALWMNTPDDIPGRLYSIENVVEYKPKLIHQILKDMRVGSATIVIQNFNLSIEEIRKRLSLKNGGDATLIFTSINNKQYMFVVSRLT